MIFKLKVYLDRKTFYKFLDFIKKKQLENIETHLSGFSIIYKNQEISGIFWGNNGGSWEIKNSQKRDISKWEKIDKTKEILSHLFNEFKETEDYQKFKTKQDIETQKKREKWARRREKRLIKLAKLQPRFNQ